MSAVERAAEMHGPVETFDGFAHLEVAATTGEAQRLQTLLAICDDAMEASQRLLAERPEEPGPGAPPSERPGLLAGLLRARDGSDEERRARQRAAMDAWFERVDALEASSKASVEAWRAAVDQQWLAAALADRDAALEALVAEGKATREMVDIVARHPFGDLLLHAALAHD